MLTTNHSFRNQFKSPAEIATHTLTHTEESIDELPLEFKEMLIDGHEKFIDHGMNQCDIVLKRLDALRISVSKKNKWVQQVERLRKLINNTSLARFAVGSKMVELSRNKEMLEKYMEWVANDLADLPRDARRYILLNERKLCTDIAYNPLRQVLLLDREIFEFLNMQERKAAKNVCKDELNIISGREDLMGLQGYLQDSAGNISQILCGNVGRGYEEKVGRIQTRLENILSGGITKKEQLDELEKMKARLGGLEVSPDSPLISIISEMRLTIDELLDVGVVEYIQEKDSTPLSEQIESDKTIGTLPQNQEFVEYLREVRSEFITYKLSSKRGGESVGDGNFIAHVWRPFITIMEHLLEGNKIDANHFSWHEVVVKVDTFVDGIDRKIRLKTLLDILQDGEVVSDWKGNWQHLVQSIDKYAGKSGFFTTRSGITPLSNFREVLSGNSPV